MDQFIDWLKGFSLWLLGVAGTAIAYLFGVIVKHGKQIAVLEKTVQDTAARLPAEMRELKTMIEEMRQESREGRERIYDRIESVRKELRDDINRESDKRSN